MGRFDGRVACVVGAAGGIGYATAARLASEGARVAMCDRKRELLETSRGSIPSASAFELDVRDAQAVESTIAAVESGVGAIDHLAITSGIFRAESFLETSTETWSDLFAVNVFGAVAVLRSCARRMQARKRGSIVVVASQSAKVVRVRQGAYGASKAALTYAVKALGLELARVGIRVNVVQPGTTDTPLARELWNAGKGSPEAHIAGSLQSFRAPIPLGKVGKAEDAANVVAFLLSDDASHVTMSEVLVDGGSSYIA